jgi:hypothetical protein
LDSLTGNGGSGGDPESAVVDKNLVDSSPLLLWWRKEGKERMVGNHYTVEGKGKGRSHPPVQGSSEGHYEGRERLTRTAGPYSPVVWYVVNG